jgi:hypothetical protein
MHKKSIQFAGKNRVKIMIISHGHAKDFRPLFDTRNRLYFKILPSKNIPLILRNYSVDGAGI